MSKRIITEDGGLEVELFDGGIVDIKIDEKNPSVEVSRLTPPLDSDAPTGALYKIRVLNYNSVAYIMSDGTIKLS